MAVLPSAPQESHVDGFACSRKGNFDNPEKESLSDGELEPEHNEFDRKESSLRSHEGLNPYTLEFLRKFGYDEDDFEKVANESSTSEIVNNSSEERPLTHPFEKVHAEEVGAFFRTEGASNFNQVFLASLHRSAVTSGVDNPYFLSNGDRNLFDADLVRTPNSLKAKLATCLLLLFSPLMLMVPIFRLMAPVLRYLITLASIATSPVCFSGPDGGCTPSLDALLKHPGDLSDEEVSVWDFRLQDDMFLDYSTSLQNLFDVDSTIWSTSTSAKSILDDDYESSLTWALQRLFFEGRPRNPPLDDISEPISALFSEPAELPRLPTSAKTSTEGSVYDYQEFEVTFRKRNIGLVLRPSVTSFYKGSIFSVEVQSVLEKLATGEFSETFLYNGNVDSRQRIIKPSMKIIKINHESLANKSFEKASRRISQALSYAKPITLRFLARISREQTCTPRGESLQVDFSSIEEDRSQTTQSSYQEVVQQPLQEEVVSSPGLEAGDWQGSRQEFWAATKRLRRFAAAYWLACPTSGLKDLAKYLPGPVVLKAFFFFVVAEEVLQKFNLLQAV